jgi:hypothetical protein
VEQEAPAQVPTRRPQPLYVPGEHDRVRLDSLEHAGGQDDRLPLDVRQLV